MPQVIDSLTPEQEAQIPGWVDKWMKIGLSTERADFDRAEAAILKCYDVLKRPRPKKVLRCASPYQATSEGIKETIKFLGLSKEDLKKNRSDILDSIYQYRGGQFFVGWTAYVSYFRDVCGWEHDSLENFKLDEEISLSCGWVWWGDHVVAISDRPLCLKQDAANNLHCEDGPAVEYSDGWKIFAWHGLIIPDDKTWIITDKKSLTASVAIDESNVELRRAMFEIKPEMIADIENKSRVLSEDVLNGERRVVFEFKGMRFISVVNGTVESDGKKRKYYLGAMPGETPSQVIAASYGINPELFKTMKEESVRT